MRDGVVALPITPGRAVGEHEDPLVGFVFLMEEGVLRGEVAQVVRVSTGAGAPICELRTTGGPAILLRETVAVLCHRTRGHYYHNPDPTNG